MKLYIAEKPSLARAIANVLPKPQKNQQGYIQLANGDCVTWCIGHLLEQAAPDIYDSKYKKWLLSDLPIIPVQWQLKPKSKTKSQLSVIRKLIKKAAILVNAGDPDREGQILVDEVIAYLKTPNYKIKQAQRLLINDLTPKAVSKSLANLKSNLEFVPLATSALARARADWLYGMNLTRAYTIQGNKAGVSGVLSVGRVQTPTLGLIVKRDAEISHFSSKPFYEVLAHLAGAEDNNNQTFTAKWQPSKACDEHIDEEGRLLNPILANHVIAKIKDKPATVTKLNQQKKQLNAPLTFNLSNLQIAANNKFGIAAKQCLDICQSLYEKHKLITYPRSDCQYLPKEHFNQSKNIIKAIDKNDSELKEFCKKVDITIISKVWNDAKVSAHHAIIPTEASINIKLLSQNEKKIYQLIAKQYLAQFYPTFEYMEIQATLAIEGGIFKASCKNTLALGWKAVLNQSHVTKNTDKQTLNALPKLKEGQVLHTTQGELITKQTQAPKPYTDASLLSAMTGISKLVTNQKIKKILKDTDGLGTEATRAHILELLIKRKYVKRNKKNLIATETGKKLIHSLPLSATSPDMTAHWEAKLNMISEKQQSYGAFMQPLTQSIISLIEEVSQSNRNPFN